MQTEIPISAMSSAFYDFVVAKCFRWSMAGKVRARGAQRTDPKRPKNLSSLSARKIERMIALRVTKKRDKFCIQ